MIVKNQNDILTILKMQMKNNGISQNDIAKKLNIARPQVTKALGGKNTMQLDTLFKYLNACGLSLDINIVTDNTSKDTTKDQ